MITAEQCFCEINNSPVRYVRGRVELYEGSTLLHTFKHTDLLKSFTVERVGESGKFFGFGIIHRLNVKLLDVDRQLNITTANTLDVAFGVGCDFMYPYSVFTVTEVHRDETTNELSITAYDALNNASVITVDSLELPESYTLADLVLHCAAALGVPFKIDADGFNLSYPTGGNFEGTETIREMLNAIAEVTQTIYYLNHNYELTFKRLDVSGAAVLNITKEKYFTLDSSTNKRLAIITHTTQLGDNLTADLGVMGSTQYIRDNPLLELREDIDTILQQAIVNVGGLTINQFNCEWRGNFLLEIGDKISLTTKDDNTVISYLLDDVITYDGALLQNSQWQYTDNSEETASNPATLGEALKQTFAKVDKVNKEIEIVAGESEANAHNIAALQMNTESIAASVSRMEETTNNAIGSVNDEIETLTNKVAAAMTAEGVKLSIQEELANGVSKVYTETGFSFDKEGLRISKTGSEMESLLDEDGLKVYRDNTEVLTANNTGVNGINMTVRQYLIVGGSRFEAYGAGRTGCFWVG